MRLSCVERRGYENLDEADEVYIPRGIGCFSRSGGEDRESVVLATDYEGELEEPFCSGFNPEFKTMFRTACGATTSSILFLRPQFCGCRRMNAPTAPR